MKEYQLKYGCNPNQKPARVYMKDDADIPFEILNGRAGYINLLDAMNSWQLVKELKEATGMTAATSCKHVSPTSAAVANPMTDRQKRAFFVDDIEGIDDTGARAFARELEDAAKSAQAQGMKMVLLMPDDSQKRVREILARDFNASEVKKAVRNGGIIIKEGNPGRGAAGCYIPMQETSSLKTPVIILGKNWDEETLVHEFTHHLRHVDQTRGGLTRTPLDRSQLTIG